MFDRNLNTGGNNETETRFVSAQQSIFHDPQHASYILLPRIP
jgi:predicted acyl esterase